MFKGRTVLQLQSCSLVIFFGLPWVTTWWQYCSTILRSKVTTSFCQDRENTRRFPHNQLTPWPISENKHSAWATGRTFEICSELLGFFQTWVRCWKNIKGSQRKQLEFEPRSDQLWLTLFGFPLWKEAIWARTLFFWTVCVCVFVRQQDMEVSPNELMNILNKVLGNRESALHEGVPSVWPPSSCRSHGNCSTSWDVIA